MRQPVDDVRGRRAPLRPGVLLLVFAGGCAGGLARYGLTLALPGGEQQWPWGVFVANTAGAFLLALLLAALGMLAPSDTVLRPALGTGFSGSFTTMSAVAVAVDRFAVDDRLPTALLFLGASALAGLAAAAVGIGLGRGVARRVRRARGAPEVRAP